jgi:hypothetical protein
VPTTAVVTNQTYPRFRVSSLGGLLVTGEAADGEVEDYALPINPRGATGAGTRRLAGRVATEVEAIDALLAEDVPLQRVPQRWLAPVAMPSIWTRRAFQVGRLVDAFLEGVSRPGVRE